MSELSEKQIKRLRGLIGDAEENLGAAKEMLNSLLGDDEISIAPSTISAEVGDEGKIIEGIFDGQIMVGNDGKSYSVPANYASKSKLVEGDLLKLTITADGKMLYKQIAPVERKTIIGTLLKHDDQYFVEAGGKEYRVLYASITYYRVRPGDQVSIIIPAGVEDVTWAAIESNI